MNKHYGQIVEYVIRKNGYSLSDLAKSLQINRRSLYNWFNQKHLKPEIIYRIGIEIKHDFAIDYPELFSNEEFRLLYQAKKAPVPFAINSADVWKISTSNCWKPTTIPLNHIQPQPIEICRF